MNDRSHGHADEELLREIMPRLGMEASAPTGQYRRRARVKYLLPRVAAVCAAALFVVAAALQLVRAKSISADMDPPRLDRDERQGEYCYLYLTDGDGSGIDWDSLAVTDADSGEPYPDASHDSANGCVRVKLTGASVRVTVQDHNANPLSLRLDPAPDAD